MAEIVSAPSGPPISDSLVLDAYMQPGAGRGLGSEMSNQDRQTLKRALIVLKAGRANAKSDKPEIAERGKQQIIIVVTYLSGFFDGKHFPTVNPGFASLVVPQVTDTSMDAQLATLEKTLEEMVTSTRLIAAAIGVALILGGMYIKTHYGTPQ